MNKVDFAKSIRASMDQHGLSFFELITLTGDTNLDLLNLLPESQKELLQIYNSLSSKEHTLNKQEKGHLLERITSLLFPEQLFHTLKNCRTSSNEIDILIELSDFTLKNNLNSLLPPTNRTFICECKNYESSLNVTYTGKFISLLIASNTKLGVLMSWNGVSGRSDWQDSKGLIKKIALKEDIYVLVLDKND